MDGRNGRFLLALADSTEEADDYSEDFNFEGLSVAVVGVVCLVCVILMCVCKDSGQEEKTRNVERQQISGGGETKSGVKQNGEGIKLKDVPKAAANGDRAPISHISPGQLHPASFTPPLQRPINSRLLPAPPVSDHDIHSKILAGSEQSSAGNETHHNIQHHSSINSKNAGKVMLNSHSDVYDHLGLKPSMKPSDYDSLSELKHPGRNNLKLEVSDGFDDDYSELDEKTFPVITDVSAKKTKMLDPYSDVTDVDEIKSHYYSQVKEEDLYNNIGDSDQTVPASLRHHLKQQPSELDDPYALVQDDSAGDIKTLVEAKGAHGGTEFDRINSPTSNNLHNSQSIQHENGENGEEYAVVLKARNRNMNGKVVDEVTANETTYSDIGASPQEPPRLYNVIDSSEDLSASGSSPKSSRTHNYSQVTARESLASISERKHRNIHKRVADNIAEDTYDTVGGWLGDSTAIGGASSGGNESRLSLISDTYDEIGISGESITSSHTNKGNNSEQINSRINITVSRSLSVDSLNQKSKFPGSNSCDIQRNPPTSSTSEGNKRLGHSTDTQEYDNPTYTYNNLETDSYPRTFGLDESRNDSLVAVVDCIPNNRVSEDVNSYPDYEVVDDTIRHMANLKDLDNGSESLGDSAGNKKVGQRRRKLDEI